MKCFSFTVSGAEVTAYLHEDHDRLTAHKVRPALVICAGGCYRWLSPREKDPAALPFFTMGYQVFLLEYSTEERAGGLRPLRELGETVRHVRAHAEEWHMEPGRIAVMGFPAGGHLAASLGVLWRPTVEEARELYAGGTAPAPEDGTENGSARVPEDTNGTTWNRLPVGPDCRPDALILCYPVITAGEYAHQESIENVTGGEASLRELLSLEKHVTPHMPPTFLWHCLGDESVPAENSMLLAAAMRRAGVPFECHLFAGGAHGISVCNQEVETPYPDCAPWLDLCKTWLNRRFGFVP